MGFGFSCTCKKCNNQQDFFLGVGYFNLSDPTNPTEKVVYVCPKCGDWNEETISQIDKKRRYCQKCKAAMRKIADKRDGIDFNKISKIICKECGDEFQISPNLIMWD